MHMHTPLNAISPPITRGSVIMGVLHSYSDGEMMTMAHYPLSLKNGSDTFNACMCLLVNRPVITVRLWNQWNPFASLAPVCLDIQQLSNGEWRYSVKWKMIWEEMCSACPAKTKQMLELTCCLICLIHVFFFFFFALNSLTFNSQCDNHKCSILDHVHFGSYTQYIYIHLCIYTPMYLCTKRSFIPRVYHSIVTTE